MENEIIVNEDVKDIAEEIVETTSKTDFSKVAGIGLVAVAGVLAYKHIVKPIMAKRKAKKEEESNLHVDDIDAEEIDTEVEVEND